LAASVTPPPEGDVGLPGLPDSTSAGPEPVA
jgi:hypothetical protein